MARRIQAVLALALTSCAAGISPSLGQDARASSPAVVEVPRIDSVVMAPKQPHEDDKAIIWYDNFDSDKPYGESSGGLDEKEGFAGAGKSMICLYEKGSQGKGNRKVFFGDCPTGKNIARKGEKFDEAYWRIYVKHQYAWSGGSPAKLSRATSLASPKWTQAMIAHVWGGGGENLTLDPASGVRGDKVVTTTYNDFANLRWLGNKPASTFKISSTAESGWWVCVEAYAKLNTPGQKDGENRLWIDGRLEAERKNLDWRGTYTGHGINAVFLEAYWNKGSPVTQTRWIDNFVISTKPVGPVVCPRDPVLIKTPYRGPGKLAAWEAELAADQDGKSVVWKSKPQKDEGKVKVEAAAGGFVGALSGKDKLEGGATYFCRIRQQGDGGKWSEWSNWHQAFVTEK